jgi:chromosome partitioning protein
MKQPHIITIVNQKGGTGKSTTVHNLGTNLARQGKKVLVVDLDSQGNLTMCLGYNQPDDLPCTMAHLLKGLIDETFSYQKENYILHAEGCDLIPSSIQLSGIEPSLANAMSRENLLKRLLSLIKDEYQYILLDCPPSLGLLTINALAAATSVLVPVQAHYLSAKGLELLIGTIAKVKRNINPALDFNGILITMYDGRLRFSKSILNELREAYGQHIRIYDTMIPQSVKAVENTAEGKSLFAYDNKCKVSLAYEAFAREVLANG